MAARGLVSTVRRWSAMTTEGQDYGEDGQYPDGTYYDRIKGWMVFHCSNSIENRQTKLNCLDRVRPIPRLDAPGSKIPFADHEIGDARFGTGIMLIDLPLEYRKSAFIVTATRKKLRTVFVVARTGAISGCCIPHGCCGSSLFVIMASF